MGVNDALGTAVDKEPGDVPAVIDTLVAVTRMQSRSARCRTCAA